MGNSNSNLVFDSKTILDSRGPKNSIDPRRPYHYLLEKEVNPSGMVENTLTIFLSNRECPFRCLMCDLWKNTTDDSVSPADLLEQIRFALEGWQTETKPDGQPLPTETLSTWKLYNSGNFFDRKAIPGEALPGIQRLANHHHFHHGLSRLIVECHPKLVGDTCLEFNRSLNSKLEVAMGLETIHPEILPNLNKQMTLDDFKRATEILLKNEIDVRAFILLRTPWMTEEEGIEWAARSVEWAFDIGVQCCAVIPTRKGNGALDLLESSGQFVEPKLESLESIQQQGLELAGNLQRLFVDVWDVDRFASCSHCIDERATRLNRINLEQRILPEVSCPRCQ